MWYVYQTKGAIIEQLTAVRCRLFGCQVGLRAKHDGNYLFANVQVGRTVEDD